MSIVVVTTQTSKGKMTVKIVYTVMTRVKGSPAAFAPATFNAHFDTQEDAEERAAKLSARVEYQIVECTETRRIVKKGTGLS